MTVRVIVDENRCVGHGICESLVPEAFEVNDDGFVSIDDGAVASSDESLLKKAVEGCPSAALRFA